MWSDRETERDCLGFLSYVSVLAEVCTHDELAPLTLGIFGSWGSGKTSLMQMLKNRLDEAKDPATKTLWFNAWQYEGREEAQSALVNAILARLEKDVTIGDELKAKWEGAKDLVANVRNGTAVLKAGRFFTKGLVSLGGAPQLGQFVEALGEESERVAAAMDCFQDDFGELLAKLGLERVIVFIDDLDRCSAEKVIETFETIKLFLNTPSCTFVIGADADKIEQAVGEVYSVTDPKRRRDYLEKIVQIPFTIPEQSLRDIACYVGMLIVGRHLRPDEWKTLIAARPGFYSPDCKLQECFSKWAEENQVLLRDRFQEAVVELQEVLPYVDILARGLRGNPRQIKRFLNILALRRRLADQNKLTVQQDLLVKLAVLEYVWPKFFDAVAETVDPDTGQSFLVQEMLDAIESGKEPESKVVSESLNVPGLISYVSYEPALKKNLDFGPYLFLAQTSLGGGKTAALAPVEESALKLARSIENEDRTISRSAAARTAAGEQDQAAAVVRILVSDLPRTVEPALATNIITGLDAICRKHRDQYAAVVKALGEVDPKENDAIAVVAGAFFATAGKNGVEVPQELTNKFVSSSKLAQALSPARKSGRK